MDLFDIIQYMSVIGSLGGMALVTFKKRIGFILWVIASLGWIVIFIHTGIYPRLFVEVVYMGQAVFAYFWWKSKGEGEWKKKVLKTL